MVGFVLKAFKDQHITTADVSYDDITGPAFAADEAGKGSAHLLQQYWGMCINCMAGCNLSPLIVAVVLMAVHHETELTYRVAVEHIEKMRPIIEMKPKRIHERCPLAFQGCQPAER